MKNKTSLDLANEQSRLEITESSKEKNGTCGRPIHSSRVGEGSVSFFDKNGNLILTIPKGHQTSYTNMLYEPAQSKQFNSSSSPGIDDVLPSSFIFRYGYINFAIKYDSLSQQEQDRVKTDIETAYDAFRETFCFAGDAVNRDLVFYIFNNRADYKKYNGLLGFNQGNAEGVTDYRSVLTFKSGHMGGNLAHELTHVLQKKLSVPEIRNFASRDSHSIVHSIEKKVEEKNYKAVEVANSSMEVQDKQRSRRSIEQPYNDEMGYNKAKSGTSKPSSLINDWFSWVKDSVGGLFGSKATLSVELGKTTFSSALPNISRVDAQMDVDGTIMLLDMLIRKFTGQKYISTADQPISSLEAQGYAFNITEGFNKAVKQAALKSGISKHRLDIDFEKVKKEIEGKIIGGRFDKIPGIFKSHIEKALPGKETGCPGKLSLKKFDKFMTIFNNMINITLDESILHSEHNTSKVKSTEEQQRNLENKKQPRSYLADSSVQGHLPQARDLRLG